jgi:nitronate monooxygenase
MFGTPIILAPIAGPGTPELTAAVCDAGGFGFLASPYSAPEKIHADVARIRSLTKKPFGINLFVQPELPPADDAMLERAHERLRPYLRELGIDTSEIARPTNVYAAQIEAVIEEKPAVFSFTFGIPSVDILARFRKAGIATMGTATTVEEARALEEAGVDCICAQGAEAGGHRGTFIGDAREGAVGTMSLVPLVVDVVKIPVIAAGGIADARSVRAVLALGAVAASIGTAFLRAHEAGTSAPYRERLANASSSDTVLTKAFSGRYARGIANRFTREMEHESNIAPTPYQNALTTELRKVSAQQGNREFLSLWAGQSFPMAREASAAEIIAQLRA